MVDEHWPVRMLFHLIYALTHDSLACGFVGMTGQVGPFSAEPISRLFGYEPQQCGRHVGDPETALQPGWTPETNSSTALQPHSASPASRHLPYGFVSKLSVRLAGQQTYLGPWFLDRDHADMRHVRGYSRVPCCGLDTLELILTTVKAEQSRTRCVSQMAAVGIHCLCDWLLIRG